MYIRSGFLTERSARRCRSCLLALLVMAGVFGIGTASAQQLPGNEKAQSKAANDKAPAAVRSWAPLLPPPPGTYKSNEVLARDLSPAERERLRQLGYVVKDSEGGLVLIVVPEGVDAWTAKRHLESEIRPALVPENFRPRALPWSPNVPGPP